MISKLKTVCIGVAITYALLAGCSKNQADEIVPEPPVAPGTPVVPVTYSAVIGPLFDTRCAGCHSTGRNAAGAWTFNGFTTVTANAARIRNAVLVNTTMPRGSSFSAAELKAVQDWYDQNMPQ